MIREIFSKPKIKKKIDERPPTLDFLRSIEIDVLEDNLQPVLIEDVKQLATSVKQNAQSLLNSIVANNPDPYFIQYYDFAKNNYWDPNQLVEDPTLRPQPYSVQEAKFLERTVFTQSVDNRAYWVQDIFRILEDTQAWEYAIDTVWDTISWPDQSPISKFTSNLIKKNLVYSTGILNRINELPYSRFDNLQDVISYYINRLPYDPDSFRTDADKLISEVGCFGNLHKLKNNSSLSNWEVLQEKNRVTGGRPFWMAVERVLFLATVTFLDQETDNMIESLENMLSLSIPDVSLSHMIYNNSFKELANSYAELESFLIGNHTRSEELFEQRSLALVVSANNYVEKGVIKNMGNLVQSLAELKTVTPEQYSLRVESLQNKYNV